MQNELQIAYQMSQQEFRNPAIVIPNGMFGIVAVAAAFCPRTDALLPQTHKHLLSLHGTRRIAEYHLRKAYERVAEGDGYDGDSWLEVWPVAPRAPLPTPTADDIPF